MSKKAEVQRAVFHNGAVLFLAFWEILKKTEPNNRTWGSRFETFCRGRNIHKQGNGQRQKYERNMDKFLLRCRLHNRNDHKKNVVFSSLFYLFIIITEIEVYA